jgi:hypothetical protein
MCQASHLVLLNIFYFMLV